MSVRIKSGAKASLMRETQRLPLALARDEAVALVALLDAQCGLCNTLSALRRDVRTMCRRRGWVEFEHGFER